MATPTDKNVEIDSALNMLNPEGKGRRESISADVCVFCNGSAAKFKDALSVKEYRISGLCQKCQDEVFG